MTDAQLIQLWNLLFPDNDSREISEQDLRDGLLAFLNTISARIGNLPNLNTSVKTSLVNAINELVLRLNNLENRFAPTFGIADPNEIPPTNSGNYGAVYIQQENAGGLIKDIGYWIYTNLEDSPWINLAELTSDFMLAPDGWVGLIEGQTWNFPAAKKGETFAIWLVNNKGVPSQSGSFWLGGLSGISAGHQTFIVALFDSQM